MTGPPEDLRSVSGDITGFLTTTPTSQGDAATIASWSTTAAEAAAWVSSPEPVTTETVLGWWRQPDVSPRLVLDADKVPVAYGEVWDDEEEDEVELARLIVDPSRRREGIGHHLVEILLDLARRHHRSECFLRVVPDNTAARALYRRAGFIEVDRASMAEWNLGQPTTYIWMQHPSTAITG